MAAPTYIEGVELRKWVKQHLSRIIFQTANDLAVQTKCEVIVKIQDSQNLKDSHYYATQALDQAFCNGGLQRESWDTDVSSTNNLLLAKSAPDSASLTVVNNISADGYVVGVSDPSASSDNLEDEEDEEDGEEDNLPTVRRHPFGIIPHNKQQNTTSRVSASQDAPSVNLVTQQQLSIVQASQPTIQITQQNAARAVVSVIPSTGAQNVQHQQQVRTVGAGAGSTTNTGPTTVVPVKQLNQLKQGQMFIMQKVGNTQMLTPVNIQSGSQSTGVVQNVVSPPPQKNKQPKFIKPSHNNTLPSSSSAAPSSGGFSGRPFKCGVCYKTFGSVQVLTRHAMTFHELVPNKRFFCDMCGKNYKHPQHLQQHMATHNSTAPYKCTQCHRGFYRMGTLKDHELLHLGMYRYYCPECRKGFMRPSLLQDHVNRFHTATVTPAAPMENDESSGGSGLGVMPSNVVPTNVVYAQQDGEDGLDNLQQQQDDEEDAANAGIEADPSSQDDLNGITIKQEPASPVTMDQNEDPKSGENVNTQGGDENNQSDQAASSCGVAAGTSRLPAMGAITSPTGQPLTSPQGNLLVKILPKGAGNYTSLKSSAQSVATAAGGSGTTPTPGKRRYSCDICGKTYKYVFHMREHRLTHSGQHPFVCKICNTGFFRQRQLREHQFRHSGSFPYSCDKCSKGFFRPSELRRHQSVKHGIVIAAGGM